MKATVSTVVDGIELGAYFDSHFIIDTVIRDFSDVYLTFAHQNPARDKVTEHIHGAIAKIIAELQNKTVQRVDGEAVSYNIRGRASKCALWKRI